MLSYYITPAASFVITLIRNLYTLLVKHPQLSSRSLLHASAELGHYQRVPNSRMTNACEVESAYIDKMFIHINVK